MDKNYQQKSQLRPEQLVSMFINPEEVKKILNFRAQDQMLIDLSSLGVPGLLIDADKIKNHKGIRATKNSLIDLIRRYDTFFGAVRPFDEMASSKVGMRAEIEKRAKQLADEIQEYHDNAESALQENQKSLLARRDFWITISVALLAACLPTLLSRWESKSNLENLEKRVQALEPKKDGPLIQAAPETK